MKRLSWTLWFLIIGVSLQAQIDYQTTNSTQGLWNIGNTPSGKVFVVGNNGTVLSKASSCGTWNSVGVPVTNGLRDVAFINDSVGIIVGVSGTIIRTTDGGDTWFSVVSGVSSGLLFAKPFGNHSFIAGGGGSSGNLVIKSDDEGATWDTLTTSLAWSPFDAAVLSDSTIVTCGVMGTVYRSLDNGVSWDLVNDSNLTGTLTSIVFLDDQIGFISAQNGNVFKTTDGGLSWSLTTTGTTTFLNAVFIDQTGVVYAAGNSGTLIHSADTGSTWSTTTLPFNTALRVLGEDAEGMLVGGNSGLLFRNNPAVAYDVIFREDFCNFNDSVVPVNGWTNMSAVDTNSVWRFDNPRSNGLDAVFEAPFAVYDAQIYNNTGRDSAILSTGDFSTNNYSEITLRWREGFLPNQDGEVKTIIQGWDGASWVTVYESAGALNNNIRTASYTGPNIAISTHRSVDLPNMGNLSNTRLRFIFVAEGTGSRFWWGIDDIEVVGGRRDVALSNLTYNDSLCALPFTDDVHVKVTNLSDFPIFPVQLAFQIGNGPVHHRYYATELDVNEDTVIVIDNIDVASVGELSVWIEDAYDRDPGNDSLFGYYGNANLMFSLGDSLKVCHGDSVSLFSGVAADQYIWNGTPQSDTLWVSSEGWYVLEVVDAGCSNIDSVWVDVVNLPQNLLSNVPTVATQNDDITLPVSVADSTIYQILMPNGSLIDTAIVSNWTLVLQDTGVYQILLRVVSNGCESQELLNINVSPALGRTDFSESDRMLLYPNPATRFIVLQNINATYVEFCDMNGRMVYATHTSNNDEQHIDIPQHLSSGVYIVRMHTRSGDIVTRKVQISTQ